MLATRSGQRQSKPSGLLLLENDKEKKQNVDQDDGVLAPALALAFLGFAVSTIAPRDPAEQLPLSLSLSLCSE